MSESLSDELRRAWFDSDDVRELGRLARPALDRLRGGLPTEQVRTWIGALHPMVSITPRLGAAAFSRCDAPESRRLIAKNLVEELAEEDHVSLYERSLSALRVPLEKIRNPEECAGERELYEEMRAALRSETALEPVVALNFGVEQGFATFCRAVVEGLERLPGEATSSREDALRYWRVHAEVDREHVAANRALIAELARSSSARLRRRVIRQVGRIARAKLRAIAGRMMKARAIEPVDLPASLATDQPSSVRDPSRPGVS